MEYSAALEGTNGEVGLRDRQRALTSDLLFDAEVMLSMVNWTEDARVNREPGLAYAISAAMVRLYSAFYSHDRTTATTYINDKIVVCVLENILSESEDALLAGGARGEVIDGRVAFQTETEDEFTAEVERLTDRHVVAFLSANQTTPGVAAELFFLDAPPDPGNVG